jgi:hypothetical protein
MFDIERDYEAARRFDLSQREAEVETLLEADPAGAQAELRRACDRADLPGTLAAAAVLDRRGLLSDAERPQYASALAAERRFAEAAAVWAQIVQAAPDVAINQYGLAETLAADGRQLRAALRAARRASELRPDLLKAAGLARRLKSMTRMMSEPASWPRLRLLSEYYMMIGAVGMARRQIDSILSDPPPGEPDVADALSLVEVGLNVRRPKAVKALLKSAAATLGESDLYRTLTIRMAEALGLPGHAAERAAFFLPPLAEDRELPSDQIGQRRRLRYHAAEAFAAADRRGDAIRQLGALVTADRRDYAALTGLQRVSGDAVLATLDLTWDAPRPPRIINLFPYYDESLLLEMRLAEMGGWVDQFVLVEATQTFTGKPKPLNFADNRERFGFGDKMINVAVESFPEWADTAWARDFHQRDMAVAGLQGRLRPDDIILITDADEIVDRRALEGYWPHLASLRMATSKHFLNYAALPGNAHANRRSGAICRGEHLARFGVTYIRTALSAARKQWETVPKAGWHFTSLGDTDAVFGKLSAYAHQEESKSVYRERSGVEAHLAGVRAGRFEEGWTRRPVDETYPRFVRENQERLAPLLL